MIDAPVGMTSQLLKGGFKAGRFIVVRRRERRETDALVLEALRAAICPTDPDGAATEKAADETAKALAHAEFPPEAHPSRLERFLPKGLRQPFRSAEDIEGPSFSERLNDWVAIATARPEIAELLKHLPCDGAVVNPHVVAKRFVACFRMLLVRRPTRFRIALARKIYEAESFQRWSEEMQRDGERTIAASATAGIGAAAIAEVAGSGEAVLIGLGVALLTGLGGLGVLESVRRRRPSSLVDAARSIALGWVADLLADRGVKGDAAGLRVGLAGFADYDRDLAVPGEMLADLRERLVPVAREAEDEELLGALRGVEDALVRGERGRRCSLKHALERLLDATEGATTRALCAEPRIEKDGIVTW